MALKGCGCLFADWPGAGNSGLKPKTECVFYSGVVFLFGVESALAAGGNGQGWEVNLHEYPNSPFSTLKQDKHQRLCLLQLLSSVGGDYGREVGNWDYMMAA